MTRLESEWFAATAYGQIQTFVGVAVWHACPAIVCFGYTERGFHCRSERVGKAVVYVNDIVVVAIVDVGVAVLLLSRV